MEADILIAGIGMGILSLCFVGILVIESGLFDWADPGLYNFYFDTPGTKKPQLRGFKW